MSFRSMERTRYLFVYGTLRRACKTHALLLRGGKVAYHGHGCIRGRMYEVDGYPGAVETGTPGDIILGEAYRLHAGPRVLKAIDRYEECGPGFPQPQEFVRKILPVQLDRGGCIHAWVYLYNRDISGLRRIPSGDYLAS